MKRKIYLIVECTTFFGLLPVFYVFNLLKVHIIVLLLIVTVLCSAYLASDEGFSKDRFWNINIFKNQIKRILAVFALNALIMCTGIWLFDKTLFFSFLKNNPFIWLLVMVLYPLISVYPQEILYRTFFFHRYRELFPTRLSMIAASAVAFAWVHVVFENLIAVLLTLAGGLLFANTYDETKSTLAAAFEHAIYGCFIFTIGLGRFFFYSAVM